MLFWVTKEQVEVLKLYGFIIIEGTKFRPIFHCAGNVIFSGKCFSVCCGPDGIFAQNGLPVLCEHSDEIIRIGPKSARGPLGSRFMVSLTSM